MDDAKAAVQRTLARVKAFRAQEAPPRLSEADTKAHFVEPIVAALGWEGIGVVTREYYVKNSQEFIDYVMAGLRGPLLALEAKPLQTDLTDKHAAQLIQYCAVEGIEWAALTNGRELQFFNTFLKPDLAAKRVLRLDLLAFNSDEEFDALFRQLWQLSRESMTTPTGVRTWLRQRRLDATVRGVLLDPDSPTIRHLRRALAEAEVAATAQELVQWFRAHLGPPIMALPIPGGQIAASRSPASDATSAADAGSGAIPIPAVAESSVRAGKDARALGIYDALREAVERRLPGTAWRVTKHYAAAADGHIFLAVKFRAGRLVLGLTLPPDTADPRIKDNAGEYNWARMTKVAELTDARGIDDDLLTLVEAAHAHTTGAIRRHTYHGVTLQDLLAAGLLPPGTPLVLVARGRREVARATLGPAGEIVWEGTAYRSPSDLVFAPLLDVTKFNGWAYWHAELPEGRRSLAEVRARLQGGSEQQGGATAREAS